MNLSLVWFLVEKGCCLADYLATYIDWDGISDEESVYYVIGSSSILRRFGKLAIEVWLMVVALRAEACINN